MEIDLIGVGVGPANLSLAALLSTAKRAGPYLAQFDIP